MLAGASRTESAYPRFLTDSNASDLLVAPVGSGLGGYFGALARLPDAGAVAPMVALNQEPLGHGTLGADSPVTSAPADRRFGQLLDVPKLPAR